MEKYEFGLPYSSKLLQITGRPSNQRDDRMGLEEFEESGQALYDTLRASNLPCGVLDALNAEVIGYIFSRISTAEKLAEIHGSFLPPDSIDGYRSWKIARRGLEKAMEMKRWEMTERETESMGKELEKNSE